MMLKCERVGVAKYYHITLNNFCFTYSGCVIRKQQSKSRESEGGETILL